MKINVFGTVYKIHLSAVVRGEVVSVFCYWNVDLIV